MTQTLSKPRLTYFSSRGRAEIIRLVLAEIALDHEQVYVGLYNPSAQPAGFVALQTSGVLPFGALPLWEEPGGLRLVQSLAIVRHLARTHGLYGGDTSEAARCDMAAEGVVDFSAVVGVLRGAPAERHGALLQQVIGTDLPPWLRRFDALLGTGDFVASRSVSFADLYLWLRLETLLDAGLIALDAYPALRAFYERIGSRPRIAAYRSDPRRFPIQPIVPPTPQSPAVR